MSSFVLLAPLIIESVSVSAQTLSSTSPGTPALEENPSSSAPTNTTACSWEDNSLKEYLKCQKDKVSSTTLIAAGLGVTVGVLVLVGLGIWLCNRQRRIRQPSVRADKEEALDIEDTRPEGSEDERRSSIVKKPILMVDSGTDRTVKISGERDRMRKSMMAGTKKRMESMSSGSEYNFTPPPPHPAHAQVVVGPGRTQPTLPSQLAGVGSPIQPEPRRILYAANDSPNLRQLVSHEPPPGPPPQPNVPIPYADRRTSILSVSTARLLKSGSTAVYGTPPLTIRKSIVPTARKPTGPAAPAYDEAIRDQMHHTSSRPMSRAHRPVLSEYGRSASAPQNVPPVPLVPGQEKRIDARRPSMPLRRATERGGMI